MRIKILVIFTALLMTVLIAISLVCLSAPMKWWGAGISALSLILLNILYWTTVKPLEIARRGIDLIRAQDFNNRLRSVGEPGADKIVTLFNDLMTKLKNERLRLREQDSFLRQLIDASPMGIVMLNLEEEIVMINRAFRKIAEIPENKEIKGNKIYDIENPLIETLANLEPGQNTIIRLSGSRLYRGYHLWFMQDGFKRHFYLIESLTDEVRIAEKEAYEKVIRMISHEVNNTMGSVQSVLEILHEDNADDPMMNETIGSCMDRCEQMCGFIDAFAEVARLPEPVLRPVNLDAELARIAPFFKLMAPEGIKIICDSVYAPDKLPEKDLKIILADIPLLQQAIVNIVKNAIESISVQEGKESFIKIETFKNHNEISLCISNNGNPISDETARHLFTPFFSTKRSGRGLGLTLVSDVLRKHNSTFSLRTDPDALTRFRILFPTP